MTNPFDVASVSPFRDEGTIEFTAEQPATLSQLQELLTSYSEGSGRIDFNGGGAAYRYDDYRTLLQLLQRLRKVFPGTDRERIRLRVLYGTGAESERTEFLPLSALFENVAGRDVSDYILHRYFTTYLQPVVRSNGSTVGYECLLRPLPEQAPFRPAELFEKARRVKQHSFLDREARHIAIRMCSAHLPPGTKRFVNFLPSSLYCTDSCLQGTFEAIRDTGTDPGDVVFEVAETERLDHPAMPGIFDKYRSTGIRIAVDDAGTGYATFDMVDRLQPDYVKLDRKWVGGCERDCDKQRHIEHLLKRSARFGGVVLAEGVEREPERLYLRQAGVPLMQGYLFGAAMPIPASMFTSTAPV